MLRPYLRVSTDDQSSTSQRHAIETFLADKKEPCRWYDDSGFSGKDQARPAFRRIMDDAKSGDTILVYAIDRLTRGGIYVTLQLRQELKAKGVKLVSITEAWIGDDSPYAELVTTVLAWAAQQERSRLLSRQKAGIAAARAQNDGKCSWGGRKSGTRNKKTQERIDAVAALKAAGQSIQAIAKATGMSRVTVYSLLKAQQGV